MLTVTRSSEFIRILPKIRSIHQMQFAKRLIYNPKNKGYGRCIYLESCCNDGNKKYMCHLAEKTANNNYDKKLILTEFELCLEKISEEMKDMRVDYKNLLNALKIYDESSPNINDSVGIFFLNCCGEVLPDVKHEIRQNLTFHVWKLIQKRNSEIPLEYYHTYLDVCAQNCKQIQPEEFIKDMKVKPDENTYKYLLNVAAKTDDVESVNFILLKMIELDYPLNDDIFNALAEIYSRKGDMRSVDSVIERMASSGIVPEDEFYGHLARGHATRGDIENVFKLLEKYSINDETLLSIIKTFSLSDRGEDIEKMLKYISKTSMVTNPYLYNTIVQLAHAQKLNDALLLIHWFRDNCDPETTIHLDIHFLRAIIRAKIAEKLVLKIINDTCKNYSSSKILGVALEESLRSSYITLSLQLLVELKNNNIEIRPHYYWPLFVQTAKQRGGSGIIDIIDGMTKMHVPFDHDTLLHYILPYINMVDSKMTLRKLTLRGIPFPIAITSLICYCLERGQIKQTLLLCKTAEGLKLNFHKILPSLLKAFEITRDINECTNILSKISNKHIHYGRFLLQLIDNKLLKDDIVALLKKFEIAYNKFGLRISHEDADLIREKLLSINQNIDNDTVTVLLSSIVDDNEANKNFKTYSIIPHPQQMTEEQLECHLIELKSKGLNYRGILRKLFMVHCKNNNYERVEEIKHEFERLEMSITLGMKATLLELYTRNKKIDELCGILEDIQNTEPNFQIDPWKIISAATALVDDNKIDLALKIIHDYGKASLKVSRHCWKLLNQIARSEHSHLTDATFDLLVENNFCDINTTVLGPLVRQHLFKNDISAAVETFKKLAQRYEKTPLRQELVCALIKFFNNDSYDNEKIKSMLCDVRQLIDNIHGNETYLFDLMIGYALNDMFDELRTALQELNTFNMSIKKFIGSIPDETKLKVLISIFDASYGIETIRRDLLCELILSIYCDTGNYEDAMNLRKKMIEQKITPSVEFEENYSDLLLNQKMYTRNCDRKDEIIS